jgi:2-haloacid dehalogenase
MIFLLWILPCRREANHHAPLAGRTGSNRKLGPEPFSHNGRKSVLLGEGVQCAETSGKKGKGCLMAAEVHVFDAYGTLFDVHSAVARNAALAGPEAARLSLLWRTKQLEYSWTRTLMGRYRDFWRITEEALDFALGSVAGAPPGARAALLDAYSRLDAYPEVRPVLTALRARGSRLAILSNGTPQMLAQASRAAGIDDLLDDILSVDAIGIYKTAPAAYALVTERYGIDPAAVSFQSSNGWDIAGATAFGFRCRWINRTGQPAEYGDLAPVEVLADLNGLVA